MVSPGDAKARRVVRLLDGSTGILKFVPLPAGVRVRSVPHSGRGIGRGRAVVVVDGRHVRAQPADLELVDNEVAT